MSVLAPRTHRLLVSSACPWYALLTSVLPLCKLSDWSAGMSGSYYKHTSGKSFFHPLLNLLEPPHLAAVWPATPARTDSSVTDRVTLTNYDRT